MNRTKKNRLSSEEEFDALLKQIVEYSLPPNPKSISEICHLTQLGRTTVNKYRKIAKERGQLATNDKGHIIKSKPELLLKVYEDILHTDFNEIPTIKTWIIILQKTYINWQKRVANLWKVCKTINRHPDVFLDQILDVEKYTDEFVTLFKQGKTTYINKQRKKQTQDISPNPYIDAIRSFRKAHGKTIPEGMLKAEQQKYDLYRKIKFTEPEIRQGIAFMAEKGEVWDRLFTIHHEFGPRANSLMNLQISHQKRTVDVDGITCEYYLCDVYESKQQRHFTKIAFTPHAKEIITNLPQGSKLHNFTDIARLKQKYNEYLREFYTTINKINPQEQYTKGTQEWYLMTDPSHAVRHSCVHKTMRSTGYSINETASMFWDKPDTLKEYAEITADEIIQRGTCYYCNPPAMPDPNWHIFCKLNHAICYYNNGQKPKQ